MSKKVHQWHYLLDTLLLHTRQTGGRRKIEAKEQSKRVKGKKERWQQGNDKDVTQREAKPKRKRERADPMMRTQL